MPTVPEVGQALDSTTMDPQQAEAEQIKTFRDFMSNYNKLSEICFEDCVWDFTTRKVLNKESTCALNCAEKYLKMNQRVSARFQVNKMLEPVYSDIFHLQDVKLDLFEQFSQEFQLMANENAMAQVTRSGKL